jgi:hypothetical protein
VDRLKALGNAQVPAVVRRAWMTRYYNPIRIAWRFYKHHNDPKLCEDCVYGYDFRLTRKFQRVGRFMFWRRWWCQKYHRYSISQAFYCAWSQDGLWGVERKLTSYRYVE